MRLLIIGPLDGQVGAASKIAMERGASVSHVQDVTAALECARGGRIDLIMVDVHQDVRKLIDCLHDERISVPVIACGIAADSRAAVEAIKAGAKEYIPLPPDANLIAAVLAAVSEDNHALIYRDPKMREVVQLAEQIAPSEASVLIVGESGCGKEVLAHLLHRKSKRADKRFVAVNCAAIPENLLESELFGHEKGAFTGAVARRIGRFEEAEGGTLLLDEISEMPVHLQAKLLRVVQEREFSRIGSNHPIKTDIRLLTTSNRNLQEEVRKKTFREDLYFRLNVVTLAIPPLRERPRDIEVLADHFARKYSEINDIPFRALSEEAYTVLKRSPWQGNVRELENAVHRAVLLGSGTELSARLFSPSSGESPASQESPVLISGAGSTLLVGRTVADVERDLIINTLQHCLGNRTHAANILGISIRTLRNKLKLYHQEGVAIPPPGDVDRSSVSGGGSAEQ